MDSPIEAAEIEGDDPLAPEVEEQDSAENSPPIQTPEGRDDDESDLSDVDEAQFDDFDVNNIAIGDRPQVAVDDSNVQLLGVHKRKRTDAEIEEARKKKKKERTRDRPKKPRKRRDGSEEFSGGEELEGKRSRKKKGDGEKSSSRAAKAVVDEVDEETLTPEERRKRALDRAMDAALANPNKRRRKKDGIDLDAMADAEIESMRKRMTEAAQADTFSRERGQPAMHKLKLLPEVIALLNRNTIQNALVDPEINLLEAVRFFLEPLNDGSLPAYNIQKEMFAALGKLPITKETLIASGIGKVVLFYTRSTRPELSIKRQAERLLSDWMRPILRRSDDYHKKEIQQMEYDPAARTMPIRPSQNPNHASNMARDRALAAPVTSNRARVEGGLGTYTIAPKNVLAGAGALARAPGRSGEEQFRRLKAKNQQAARK